MKPPLEPKVQAAFLSMLEAFFDRSSSALEVEHAALVALERDNMRMLEAKGEARCSLWRRHLLPG